MDQAGVKVEKVQEDQIDHGLVEDHRVPERIPFHDLWEELDGLEYAIMMEEVVDEEDEEEHPD